MRLALKVLVASDVGAGLGDSARQIASITSGRVRFEQVVVALLVRRQVEVAAIVGLGQLRSLDHRAVGAVLDQDALGRLGAEGGSRGAHAALRSRRHAEQVADRVAQLGAVEGVEMEVADAAGIELAAQFGGDGRGDQLARGRAARRALRTAASIQAGNRRAALAGECGGLRRRWTPAGCRARSRRRCRPPRPRRGSGRSMSAEKKNWVIARSAPASILRFRLSRSASALRRIGMALRDRRRPKSRTARPRFRPATSSAALA